MGETFTKSKELQNMKEVTGETRLECQYLHQYIKFPILRYHEPSVFSLSWHLASGGTMI